MKNASESGGRRLSRRQWLVVVLTLLFLAVWIGVNAVSRLRVALHPPPPEQMAPLAVETLRLERQIFERRVRYSGTIVAEREAVLQSRVTAQILEMPARSGERVERGDLLVRLDDDELTREVSRLQAASKTIDAELVLARKQLERRRQLLAVSAVSQEQVDEARARVDTLQAALEENHQAIRVAQSRLNYTRISAPFSGTIGRLHALPGDLAAPGRALIELVDPRELKAVVTIPQQDLSAVTLGTLADIRIPALKIELQGRVDRLHPALQLPGRGAQAEIILNGHIENLLPGMEAVIHLLTVQRDHVLVIPVEALHRRGDKTHVFVLEDDMARRRSVTPGPEYAGRVVIENGLAPDDILILTPHPELTEGRAVVAGERP